MAIVRLGDDEQVLLDYFIASDFFIMPSTAEAFGLMAIEAMACDKPVIVFDRAPLPEVCFAPELRVAVPMQDANALAAAIGQRAQDRNERRMRGERGLAMAEKHYTARHYAGKRAALYRSVSARRRFREASTETVL